MVKHEHEAAALNEVQLAPNTPAEADPRPWLASGFYIALIVLLLACAATVIVTQKSALQASQDHALAAALMDTVALAPDSVESDRAAVLMALYQLKSDFAAAAASSGAFVFVYSVPLLIALLSGTLPMQVGRRIILLSMGVACGVSLFYVGKEGGKVMAGYCYMAAIDETIQAKRSGKLSDVQLYQLEHRLDAACLPGAG